MKYRSSPRSSASFRLISGRSTSELRTATPSPSPERVLALEPVESCLRKGGGREIDLSAIGPYLRPGRVFRPQQQFAAQSPRSAQDWGLRHFRYVPHSFIQTKPPSPALKQVRQNVTVSPWKSFCRSAFRRFMDAARCERRPRTGPHGKSAWPIALHHAAKELPRAAVCIGIGCDAGGKTSNRVSFRCLAKTNRRSL